MYNNKPFTLSWLLVVLFFSIASSQDKFKVKGTILSGKDNSPLIGATVEFKGTKLLKASDEMGQFDLLVASGRYSLNIRHLGYKPFTEVLSIYSDTSFTILLVEENIQTSEIEIKNDNESALKAESLGLMSLNIAQVKKLPTFLGEPDIIKIIQFMPGVISAGEGSSAFFVRGGNADENLILLDNAPIYDPSHMLGLFSIFNANIIKSAELHKNGMPAAYGGRISSLLDVKTNDGNMEKYHGNVTVGLLAAKLYLNGPIVKNKISFAASARRSYVDNLIGFGSKVLPSISTKNSLYFYDLNAKLKYIINPKNSVSISAYSGQDKVLIGSNADVNWGNSFANLQWKHSFNQKTQLNTAFIASRFGFQLAFENGNQNFSWTNSVNEYTVRQDYNFNPSKNNKIDFGFISSYRSISPARYDPISQGSVINSIEIPTNHSSENAIYINHSLAFNRWEIGYGIRYSLFASIGPYDNRIYTDSKEVILPQTASVRHYNPFQPIKTFTTPEPRLSLGYKLSAATSIRASYNRMAQYIHQIIAGITPLPISFWIPSSTYINPSIGDNFSLGILQKLPFNIETSLELFYKRRTNTIDFVDNAVMFLNPDVITQIRSGNSHAYGAELFISQAIEKLKWNVSYTLSKAERQIDGINQNQTYYAPFDRRHSISALATYQWSEKWDFGLSWSFSSGRPITMPSGIYQFQQYTVNYITERNGYRMPDYHRLDISANFKPKQKAGRKWQSEWNFSIYNVYNRYNAFAIFTKPKFDANSQNNQSGNQAIMIYLFTVVPSISYTARF